MSKISCKSISKVGFFAANVSHGKVRLSYASKLEASCYRQWSEIGISKMCKIWESCTGLWRWM